MAVYAARLSRFRLLKDLNPADLDEASGTGTATVSGSGSTWNNSGATGNLFVGESGTGALTIQNGGLVESTSGIVVFVPGSNGTVNVDGAGATWATTALQVGRGSGGTLNITGGGVVSGALFGSVG